MNGQLVCGDVQGGIRIDYDWVQNAQSDNTLSISRLQYSLMQFRGSSIACMGQLDEHLLALSIQPFEDSRVLPSALSLPVTSPRGVYILDTKESSIKAILDAHRDTVTCMCSLPDGGLLSAGGKMDATVRVWDSVAASNGDINDGAGEEVKIFQEARIMKQPGYVFDLQVLPDSNGSGVYAISAARYNVIKIVI